MALGAIPGLAGMREDLATTNHLLMQVLEELRTTNALLLGVVGQRLSETNALLAGEPLPPGPGHTD